MLPKFRSSRYRRLINDAIHAVKLDLSGLTVLTEAATGYFVFTPLIAALAGADLVLAFPRDSSYATRADVCEITESLASACGVADRVVLLPSLADSRVAQADIVTNSGFLRPLHADFLRRLKPTVAIPLMFETWEFRSEDLDLAECRRLGIPILGTNEHCPELRIFGYIGHIALKLLYELHFEVFRSRIAVLGSGDFGDTAEVTLRRAGAEVSRIIPVPHLDWHEAKRFLSEAEVVVVVEYHTRRMLLGPGGEIEVEALRAVNPDLAVAHICGGVDRAALEAAGFCCWPERFAASGYMSVATDYVGPRPLVDLQSGGLKVGECMARARMRGLTGAEAEAAALAETGLAQPFPKDLRVEGL